MLEVVVLEVVVLGRVMKMVVVLGVVEVLPVVGTVVGDGAAVPAVASESLPDVVLASARPAATSDAARSQSSDRR
jgi:hypothetical protein